MTAKPKRTPRSTADDLTSKAAALQVTARTDREVRTAQLVLASVALRHPRLTCPEQEEAELEEVLSVLGIRRRIEVSK